MCDWYRPDSYHSKFKRECEDIIARRMAEAIASIGREEHERCDQPDDGNVDEYPPKNVRPHEASLVPGS